MRGVYKGLRITFLILLVLLVLLFAGKLVFEANYVVLDGEVHSCRETELDLSGGPVSDLEALAKFKNLQHLDLRGTGVTLGQQQWLQKRLPDCKIEWEIEFQGSYYPPDTQELTLSSLNTGEVVLLDFLPELRRVDASKCRDYEALQSLEERHPGCEVIYSVELGGKTWERSATALELESVTADLLQQRLPSLPLVEEITLTGILPTMKEIRSFEKTWPEIAFRWKVELGGLELEGDTETLVLSGSELTDPEKFVEKLPYFPNLKSVDLRETKLDNTQKKTLTEAYTDLSFQWDVAIGDTLIPVDADEAEVTGESSAEEIRKALPCFKDLQKLVLLDSGLSNEELDALNQEFPDTRVVWNMDLGGYLLRTDDIYYAPNKYYTILSDEVLEPLRYCTDMQCVDVGHGKITSCEWAAYMPELRYLIIADTKIADVSPVENLKKLVFLEMFQTPVKDYTPLLGCTALEDLNLCYSFGDPAPVMEMTWLKRLWWEDCRASQKTLEEHLPDTQVECNSHSSTGAGWRQGQHYFDMRDLIGMEYMTD